MPTCLDTPKSFSGSYCVSELMGGLGGLLVTFLVLFVKVTVATAPLLFFTLPGIVDVI